MKQHRVVEKYASMWPREVCDLPDETGKLFIRHFKDPGVYVLYRDDVPHYIGQARQLGPRIWEHANRVQDRYYNFWNMFSMFVVKDKKYLADVERILIAAMPTANSARPRIPQLGLARGILQRLTRIRKHEVDPITRRDFERFIRSVRRKKST